MKKTFVLVILSLLCTAGLFAQSTAPRVAFLPFTNQEGELELNVWCYDLQDSLQKRFAELDPEEKYYRIIPYEEIETILSDMNFDPANPQFASDMWKVVEQLNADYVISGNFVIEANRFLINTYIYDVSIKLPVTTHQARDIFVPLDKVMRSIVPISKKLSGYFIK